LFILLPTPSPPFKRKDTIIKRFFQQPFVLKAVCPTISLFNFMPANGFDKDIHPPSPPTKNGADSWGPLKSYTISGTYKVSVEDLFSEGKYIYCIAHNNTPTFLGRVAIRAMATG
jgi:hypothetical protein